MNLDVLKISSCVGSGHCCKQAPCPFGEWDAEKQQCQFLEVAQEVDGVEIHRCGKYDEIIRQKSADLSPAFGAGCCQLLFNTTRSNVLRLAAAGRISLPYGSG